MTNPLDQVAAHVVSARTENLPPEVVAKAKTFLLDTFGVGIAGSSGTGVTELINVARGWGSEPEASILATGEKMCAQSAALVNAYQIHCLEFDCVHEGAVLHPMATILGAVMAWSERQATRGQKVHGNDLIAALVVGVDVSTMLGIATDSELRFFRPATAGGFGAAAAIGRLEGFDSQQMKDAFGDFGVADEDTFYKIVNRVNNGFIRTEADELQYNLHVLLRFDLERALVSHDLQVADLEAAWNDRFEADFGYPVDRASNGVLQDVHWSVGLIGYFPTYSLGNVYAGCLNEAMRGAVPDLDSQLAQGDTSAATTWLGANLQTHGGLYEPRDIIEKASGVVPSEAPLLAYLKEKFSTLYNL